MVRLALDQAPAPAGPGRFLHTVPAWGALAGLMLMVEGPALLLSRWSPATVALVHVFTLGVLGNAMFGSLLQFLPAAAGVRVRGGSREAAWLHGALNLGSAALVAGLWWPSALLRGIGACALALAFLLLVSATLPGVLARARNSLLHAGIGLALTSALATAALGLVLVGAMAGHVTIPVMRWTDVHAATGLLGWVMALLVAVARVVMPMFQGAPAAPAAAQAGWLMTVAIGLPLAGLAWLNGGVGGPLRALVVAAVLSLAGMGLWLQSRSRKSVPGALAGFWRIGFCALVAGALVLALPDGRGPLAGVLVLAIGLPMLVLGMLLEIAAFLGWIELHRRCGRGLQLPGVQLLLPPSRRRWVLRAFALASAALLLSALWPGAIGSRLAGALLLSANGVLAWSLAGIRRGVREFAAVHTTR